MVAAANGRAPCAVALGVEPVAERAAPREQRTRIEVPAGGAVDAVEEIRARIADSGLRRVRERNKRKDADREPDDHAASYDAGGGQWHHALGAWLDRGGGP